MKIPIKANNKFFNAKLEEIIKKYSSTSIKIKENKELKTLGENEIYKIKRQYRYKHRKYYKRIEFNGVPVSKDVFKKLSKNIRLSCFFKNK